MNPLWRDILISAFLGMILPGIMLNGAVMQTDTQETEPVPAATIPDTAMIPVLVRIGEDTAEMEMDQYITGVVLAEMPASFELEALKAQSVAARTYTWKAIDTGGKHGDGSICTDSRCCQGYISKERYLSMGGVEASVDKIRQAVEETSGCVLMYEGELIEATYFSCSGGTTEDASAVWGTEYPYLQSVSSPGEEAAAFYTQTVVFTPEEFQSALGKELNGTPKSWFHITTYTEGGGVAFMTIGAEVYSGAQLRSALGLRSTAFTVEASSTQISITTRGYGHRVGMSQYGADAMALSGNTYEQILQHYYPGTSLVKLSYEAYA